MEISVIRYALYCVYQLQLYGFVWIPGISDSVEGEFQGIAFLAVHLVLIS
jgi:hypothetical protein